MLTAAVNVSEGRDPVVLAALAAAAGAALLDRHADPDHHRSVFTLGGPEVEAAVAALAAAAVARIDLRAHRGVHPRFGVVDVVPWVAWSAGRGGLVEAADAGEAVAARRRFALRAASTGVPVACYGPAVPARPPMPALPARTLPELRRRLWADLEPDVGPRRPHPTAGATAAGVRGALVAYNLWLADPDLGLARQVAAQLRGPAVRALGLAVGAAVQVSCNLVDPWRVGPGAVFDEVAARAPVARAELVGLVPAAVVAAEPTARWAELDLDPSRTLEGRLEDAGFAPAGGT
ncbi:MAG TPA: hypothetical protein VFP61_05275 [Acidimicrobiales bacterium]|nr:hypothetical protein [Acidimicrobiales bacterium]